MRKWKCSVCGYIYDEARESIPFEDPPPDWTCPQCGAPKSAFKTYRRRSNSRRSQSDSFAPTI